MKPSILLLAVSLAAMTGCNTAYKSGQTPDDVYFSPTPPKDEYVRVEKQDDRRYSNDEAYDDRYLRMKVQNRYRWSMLDDPYYYENRYTYSFNTWNNPWNQNYLWNYFYNPYCNSCCTYVNPKNGTAFNFNGGPRTFNLNTFTTKQFTSRNTNAKNGSFSYSTPTSSGSNTRSNDNDERKSNAGNLLRSLFSKEEKSSSSSTTPSNSSSGSSSSSTKSSSTPSSSPAPVRRF